MLQRLLAIIRKELITMLRDPRARYSLILARCVDDACRLQVEASSLRSAAPQRSSTQSLTL